MFIFGAFCSILLAFGVIAFWATDGAVAPELWQFTAVTNAILIPAACVEIALKL